ncbi:ATP-binding protein [Devosia sp.]|uniref:ATP-binding protein n=1 Tax=Devosia sp. TaxID=1871048 RepID=UPI002EE1CA28
MKQRSLRLRLLIGAAIWVTLTVLVTGAAIFYLFRASVERDTRADLEATLDRLSALIQPGAQGALLREPLPDPRYELPYGGVYWQIQSTGGIVLDRSRSLWDHVLHMPDGADLRQLATLAGPDGQTLAGLARHVAFGAAGGGQAYLVTVAEDRSILDQTIREFGSDMALTLLTLGIAILGAAWLVVQTGLSPLDALRRGIEAVRRGDADKLVDGYPSEVLPLVAEVNELLALRGKSVEFARARAADLAHGLKTPLQVLTATADKLRKAGDQGNAAAIDDIVAEMSDRIDYQLRLARLRLRAQSDVISTSLNTALTRTVSVIRQTHAGESLAWNLGLGPDTAVNIDGSDLLELAGVLLENAAKWARNRVDVTVRPADAFAEVIIADDGPGLTEEQIARLGVRGRRLDESRRGSGFGMAIAMEILELNNGAAVLGRSELGGLAVTLRLPLAGND